MFSWIYWDPKRELFTVPFLDLPILWYSALFAMGFFIGILILQRLFENYFAKTFSEGDILDAEFLQKRFKKKEVFFELNELLKGTPRIEIEKSYAGAIVSVKTKAKVLVDRLLLYMILATIIGARLGHLLFYESPSYYLSDPLKIFEVWKGGLASHGAAVAILIGIWLFRKREKLASCFSHLMILDFLMLPAALCGMCIRIGNFFNQEILGKATELPWAVLFGHPMGREAALPRHPVQLYEALFYLAVFLVLWFLRKKEMQEGLRSGIFFLFVFGFRFLIEFLKEEQSVFFHFPLTMGQLLSLPFIALGFVLLIKKRAFSLKNF